MHYLMNKIKKINNITLNKIKFLNKTQIKITTLNITITINKLILKTTLNLIINIHNKIKLNQILKQYNKTILNK